MHDTLRAFSYVSMDGSNFVQRSQLVPGLVTKWPVIIEKGGGNFKGRSFQVCSHHHGSTKPPWLAQQL
jgi:hypothetical protein